MCSLLLCRLFPKQNIFAKSQQAISGIFIQKSIGKFLEIINFLWLYRFPRKEHVKLLFNIFKKLHYYK